MFATSDLVWFDFETRSTVDIKKAGTAAYVRSCEPIMLAYAIGDGPVTLWERGGKSLSMAIWPGDLQEAFRDGVMKFAAWNSPFDRAVWNGTMACDLEPRDVLDVMAQATASNLPAGLDAASERLGCGGKQKDGKALIHRFCVDGLSPEIYPDEWKRFGAYAMRDVEAMREIYRRTRPLPLREWEEFWAAETINERGIGVDVEFATKAAQLAALDTVEASKLIRHLTNGAVSSITNIGALTHWVHERLDAYGRSLLETIVEDDESVEEGAPATVKLSLRRKQITALLAYLRGLPGADVSPGVDLIDALALREYGGGAAPKKFARMVAQADENRLKFQFSFNGASQTGRFSGRGVQLQNLTRQSLDAGELPTMNAILDGATPAELRAASMVPVSRQLALLVRPSLIAEQGKCFVWSDWSQIEARVLPWLSDSRGGDAKLDIFREIDLDPSKPDLYQRAAAAMYGRPVAKDSPERQAGKIAELALGFNGGKGALQSMAANYDQHFDDAEAQEIVDAWRAANQWCVRFWGKHRGGESYGLWGAAMRAIESPGLVEPVGRVGFLFDRKYLGGTLFMGLPSGRLLTYPSLKLETSDDVDRATGKKTGDTRTDWTFRRQVGRLKLWPGLFAENATQATAACILRGTLKRLVDDDFPVVAHVHDEVILEVPTVWGDDMAGRLRAAMRQGFDWSAGLPLWSDETVNGWYTKRKIRA